METYYKVSLYDDYNTTDNRKLLGVILHLKFLSEGVLNKLLTDLNSPFLLTAIAVSEYNSEDDELIGFVTWSELNERLRLNTTNNISL